MLQQGLGVESSHKPQVQRSYDIIHVPTAKGSKTRQKLRKYLSESLSRDLSTNGIRCTQQTTPNPSNVTPYTLQNTTAVLNL